MSRPHTAIVLALTLVHCADRPASPRVEPIPRADPARAPLPVEAPTAAMVPAPGYAWAPSEPATQPGSAAASCPHASGSETRGTVLETMDAGGYTYLRIDTGSATEWVATTAMAVAVGDRVVVADGTEMTDFHSRTLARTFPSIVFAGAVRVEGRPAQGAAAAPVAPAGNGAQGTVGTVLETMNAGAYTYLRVESPAGSRWAAVPHATVSVGDRVEVPAGAEMPGFRSPTLGRTFEQITFAPSVRVVAPAPR
jgi:hypothetical protein